MYMGLLEQSIAAVEIDGDVSQHMVVDKVYRVAVYIYLQSIATKYRGL